MTFQLSSFLYRSIASLLGGEGPLLVEGSQKGGLSPDLRYSPMPFFRADLHGMFLGIGRSFAQVMLY